VVNFNLAMQPIFRWEGGYVNDPDDRGGETKYGITKKRYPNLDIKNLTKEKAAELYYDDFWKKYRVNEFRDQNTATHFLDTIINHGPKWGTTLLQRALNDIGIPTDEDGKIGPQTIKNANSADSVLLNTAIGKRRLKFYDAIVRNNPSQKKFLKGWKKRANYYINSFGGTSPSIIIPAAIAIGIIVYKVIEPKLKRN
jgi:lysozyme family protein